MLFRTRTLIVASTLAFCASAALAQDPPAKSQTPQQKRMAECSAANKGKHGDEYKSAMSACLKGEKPAATLTPQQQRMKDCNAQAGKQSLSGEKRKTFMSSCLKGTS
ncbi:PsiF family protein [Bordetella genomosp. 9]|uniref:PsiF repeat family protein n=1 Tax=Bordetella genomosp. 9 TaxID=1416803 RepID=A0A1W6YVA0_9BORD|nr:PsiF family protein [Bordetella genomosp. 9]ARP84931.1 PsiF repeat family protein [Bordetella genomosp. 9]ARP89017.1 PsiF repeat family protein [Bordetella genomosp. 9]